MKEIDAALNNGELWAAEDEERRDKWLRMGRFTHVQSNYSHSVWNTIFSIENNH